MLARSPATRIHDYRPTGGDDHAVATVHNIEAFPPRCRYDNGEVLGGISTSVTHRLQRMLQRNVQPDVVQSRTPL